MLSEKYSAFFIFFDVKLKFCFNFRIFCNGTFWFKRFNPISLIQTHDPYNGSLYVLHSTFILANSLNWIFINFHIVPEALHLNITVNAHPGRIIPNRKSSI
jgi:hypothetical protein